MRLTASPSIAAISLLAAVALVKGAPRPHYGGTLRMEIRAMVASLDPAETPADPAEAEAKEQIAGQVFETLVRLDDKGDPQAWLATSWNHEPSRHRWVFTARKGVMLHNGTEWMPPGGIVAVNDDRPIEQILLELAKPQNAVVVRGADGTLIGTGPFRIAHWDSKKAVTLEAHEAYWGGRPYLDRVEIRMGRSQRDQAVDLELARADAIELPLTDVRRLQQQGRVSLSAPEHIVALVFGNRKAETDRVREALSLSIDRATIHKVLLQQQGEVSGALLPQWLSGDAFLFPATRNLGRARELAVKAGPLSFAYDSQQPLRSIAERIVLNAAEAGLTLRPATGATADIRMMVLRVTSTNPWQALQEMSAALHSPFPAAGSDDPSKLYEAERLLIAAPGVVPVLHLPEAWQLSPSVRAFKPGARLDNVWLDPRGGNDVPH